MFDLSQLLWSASVEEISNGYVFDSTKNEYICMICGEHYKKGRVYPEDDAFYEAEMAICLHIEKVHKSVFDYLIHMNPEYSGLSEIQQSLLLNFYNGLSDKEISKQHGAISESTVRVHRFKLKEKEKQAKVFLALMNLLAKKQSKCKESKLAVKDDDLVQLHRNARKVDERYAITNDERTRMINAHFDKDGKLKDFSIKVKHKIAVLQHIVTLFDTSRKYSEKEVNDVLKSIYDDFATLRRALIEYGFMEREKDGSSYWVTN